MHSPKLLRQLAELRGVLHLLASYLIRVRRTLLLGIGITLLLLILRVAQPWPLKWIIDALGTGELALAGIAAFGAAFLLITATAALLEYTQVMMLTGVGNRVMSEFRIDLFRQVLRQSLTFHERKAEGELLTRVVYDTTRLRKGINNVLTRLLQTLLTFIAVIGVLFWVDVVLGAVIALAGTACLVMIAVTGNRVRKAARKNRKREGKLATLVTEELLAVRELQTFRAGETHGPAFANLNAKSLKQESKVRRLASSMLLRVDVLLSAGLALGLLLGAGRVAAGLLTPGELVLFASYATALLPSFFRFARQTAQLGGTLASAERLERMMLRRPEIAEQPGGLEPERLTGLIELRDVALKTPTRLRGTRKWALQDVTLRFEPGERVVVLGGNGAGKSSLLRLLLRLADPQRGSVRFDGADVRAYSPAALRSQMSVVLQDTILFGRSVRENVAAARPESTEAEIVEALRRADALALVNQLPQGLDTIVRKQGRLLSGGERQRLAIARALLRDGRIWLLDEPTSGVDALATERLIRVLADATRGRTTFWVSHDPRLTSLLDRVLYLVDGHVRFFGTRDEFRDWMEFGDQLTCGAHARSFSMQVL